MLVSLGLMGLAVGFMACAAPAPRLGGAGGYQEMFDKALFLERVRLLHSVNHGASQQEVLAALGAPQAREVTPEGYQVLVYRVRCYAGPEPFSRQPRLLSLTTESRIILDGNGRVVATTSTP